MNPVRIYTIGFTKKSAEQFFTKLADAGVKRVVDVRLNNISQLAGFAKKDDLRFLLKGLHGIDYLHETQLAPTQDMLDAYKKNGGEWPEYERRFLGLLESRRIEETIDRSVIDESCLLCSEDQPKLCHRRLVAEYLERHWGTLDTKHLV